MNQELTVLSSLPHWEKIIKFNKIKYMCSECRGLVSAGAEAASADIGERNYCPHCGVKMEYVKL